MCDNILTILRAHRNPNDATTPSLHMDSYAYDYAESPGGELGRSQHAHQMKLVAGAAADKRKRQAAAQQSAHRASKRSSSSGAHSSRAASDDSDEFDGGDEYDSLETGDKGAAAGPPVPTMSSTVAVRKPFWDTYDAVNQLYLEIGEFCLCGCL